MRAGIREICKKRGQKKNSEMTEGRVKEFTREEDWRICILVWRDEDRIWDERRGEDREGEAR